MNRFSKAVLAVSFAFIATACATSTAGDLPCESDEDCPVGTACDLEQNQCVRVRLSSNADPNAAPGTNNNSSPFNNSSNNPLNNINRDMGTDDDMGGDPSMPDTEPVTCDPECGDDEVCDRGTCVSACDPECEAPEVCTADGCQIPDCSAVGDPCDLDNPDQGDFACLEADGEGICLATCDAPFSAGDCPTGDYCWTLDEMDVCVPKTCSDNGDCDQGSCIDFDNDFAICFEAGTLAEGAACDPDDNQCEEGTFCRETGSGTGVCSRLCDQWSASPGCPAGEYCATQFTSRTALCTDNVDPAAPKDPFLVCSDPGQACDDAVSCFEVGTQNGCLKYCRPGANDCQGVTDGTGSDTICDNYAFGGERSVGVCWPPCDPMDANPCGEGVCVDEICRTTCTPGNAVQDCCGGAPSCPFECNPNTNLCE
jgi:hypothetical protein